MNTKQFNVPQDPDTLLSFNKVELFGVNYASLDYELASKVIADKATNRISYGVSALAVHGLMESRNNPRMKKALSQIDMITPDGQPIKWAMNFFHQTRLKDRVYGPKLTECVIALAEKRNLGIYLYGSTSSTLSLLQEKLLERFPNIKIAGVHIDRFRDATEDEDIHDVQKINESGAQIVLVGRGCPRQEIWVGEHKGKINAVMMAVGAAFDFHAGTLKQAPSWMQDRGLEWLYRLYREPKRLWKRYLITNTKFIVLTIKKLFKPNLS
jgi:exopolysaccharide biosynthesis WecB/TagA/CpsF family protein